MNDQKSTPTHIDLTNALKYINEAQQARAEAVAAVAELERAQRLAQEHVERANAAIAAARHELHEAILISNTDPEREFDDDFFRAGADMLSADDARNEASDQVYATTDALPRAQQVIEQASTSMLMAQQMLTGLRERTLSPPVTHLLQETQEKYIAHLSTTMKDIHDVLKDAAEGLERCEKTLAKFEPQINTPAPESVGMHTSHEAMAAFTSSSAPGLRASTAASANSAPPTTQTEQKSVARDDGRAPF